MFKIFVTHHQDTCISASCAFANGVLVVCLRYMLNAHLLLEGSSCGCLAPWCSHVGMEKVRCCWDRQRDPGLQVHEQTSAVFVAVSVAMPTHTDLEERVARIPQVHLARLHSGI